MSHHFKFVTCLLATLCTELAIGQVAATQIAVPAPSSSPNSPAAYVYVSSNPSGNSSEIVGYSASSDGKLTVIAGSPFAANVQYMAVNGKYLFGSNGIDIDSFSIASNGALQQVSSINAQRFNSGNCGGPWVLFTDRTGASLYDNDIYSDCANNAYQFFGVDSTTGSLDYLGVTSASSPEFEGALSLIGNNQYGYGASCYHWYQEIYGFSRASDGALTDLNLNTPIPAAKPGNIYCPGPAAADSSNHVAVAMSPISNSSLQPSGLTQLATYTADSSGNLTTASTYSNMPKVAVGATDIALSPSGKLLAVAGPGGLQVFHFNGSAPITHFSDAFTKDSVEQVDQIFWDNADHLYAVSQSAGKLFVFTVTPTSYSQADGSPYTLAAPQTMVVLSR
jgi:hypothetical protein